ncbi:MAG: hypothetical protein LC114_26325, partial [Bryobacterales bacterium]|nr:hypothetical protein [Bryobacterales bacterium]
PSPSGTPDDPVDTVDTVDALDTLMERAYRQLLAEFLDTEDIPQPDHTAQAGQATHGQPASDFVDTPDTVDNTDRVDTLGTTDAMDTTDKVATTGTVDTSDKTGAENPRTHRGIAEAAALMRIGVTPDTVDPVSSADAVDKLDPKPPATLQVEPTSHAHAASPNPKQGGERRSVLPPVTHSGVQVLALAPFLSKAV